MCETPTTRISPSRHHRLRPKPRSKTGDTITFTREIAVQGLTGSVAYSTKLVRSCYLICIMRRAYALGALATVAFLASVTSARAIEVCYDYAIYRLTGTDPRPPGSDTNLPASSRADMEKALDKAGYKVVTPRPSGRELKPDDIVLVPGHVGYVNAPNAIDHFVQRQGETIRTTRHPNPSAHRYPAENLPGPLNDENDRPLT